MNAPGPQDTAAVRASVVRMTASALVILGVYAVVPVSSAQDSTSVLVLVGGLALLGGIVGFGDVSATSDLSRLLFSTQIVINVTLLAAAVRVILKAARSAPAGGATAGDVRPDGR